MNKINFLMAIHFHQPIGNFDFVFQKICRKSYQPFIDTVKEFPDIKLNFHLTGCLLEWFKANNPKILDDIKFLVKRGQVEIITGAFYEPILPVIPRCDRLGQIKMLTEFVKKNFQYQPHGAWIAERVWEPDLASSLNEAGVKYVILDDTHLKYAGLKHYELHGYYMTEDDAKPVAVFPSDKKLRYLIPFGSHGDVIGYLRSVSQIQDGLAVVYGDDAEKFGEWPDTYEWVYQKRWLYNFFTALQNNSSWIKTSHMSEYLANNQPLGNVYIPAASYQEMSGWALPPDEAMKFDGLMDKFKSEGKEDEYGHFLKGGFWRNFLTKYPESNQMHKKMLRISKKIEAVSLRACTSKYHPIRGLKILSSDDAKKFNEAQQELYKGQCNCAYWHGVFGGLYLYHLRSAVYRHLIRAEALIDGIIYGKKGWLDCQSADFDSDGYPEAVVSNSLMSLFFDADEGGSLTEFDLKAKSVNIVNTLTRRKEAYHAKLLAQIAAGSNNNHIKTIHERPFENVALAGRIYYDWYRRACMLDHFFGVSTTIENFSKCQYEELGDFVNQPFDMKQIKNGIVFSRNGQIAGRPLNVTKTVEFGKDSADIKIIYRITNTSETVLQLWFASEFNFSLTEDDTFGKLENKKEVLIKDASAGFTGRIIFSKPVSVWRFPVNTVSQSESDIEENYQSSVILPHSKFELAPGKSWDLEISLKF